MLNYLSTFRGAVQLFIGDISNAIVHKILGKATAQEELIGNYNKELLNSLEIAKKYREKINPINSPFPPKDTPYIKEKITNRVKAELLLRISKGYEDINLNLVEKLVDRFLKEMNVID